MARITTIANSWFETSLGTFYNLLTVVLVYGVEEVIRIQLLRCPCDNFTLYGSIALSAPAVCFVGLGFITRDEFWKVVATSSKIYRHKVRVNYLMKSLTKLFLPFLPAAAFVTFALLRGDFFVCVKAGAVDGCDIHKDQNSQEELTRLHVQSQILGFGLLVGLTIFSAGLVLVRRCCFDDDSLPTPEEFSELESASLERIFREKLGEILEKDLKTRVERAFRSAGEGNASMVFYRAKQDVRGFTNIKLTENGYSYRRLNVDEDELDLHNVNAS